MQQYACTAIDVIARRTRLAFLNVQAAEQALPRIVDVMGKQLGWNEQKKQVPPAHRAPADRSNHTPRF